jgi:UPF0042 nucleotide-binding protein
MRQLVVITGMSGSGKSVALRALEDAGYSCVDNLPPQLLEPLIGLDAQRERARTAVAMDVRSGAALPQAPRLLRHLRRQGLEVRLIFLDAGDDVLLRRFSETRRRHPLSSVDEPSQQQALGEAIAAERALLAGLRRHAHVIDTSALRPLQLQSYVKALIAAPPSQLTLVFESFAFKHGVALDADFVFDVRMLPNPHYEPALRALTGRDAPVIDFLRRAPEAARMLQEITAFLRGWLPALEGNQRSYVTVAIGCTGGQHRSVYLAEQLAAAFAQDWHTLTRHRELPAE